MSDLVGRMNWAAGWVYLGFISVALSVPLWIWALGVATSHGELFPECRFIAVMVPVIWLVFGYLVAIGFIK